MSTVPMQEVISFRLSSGVAPCYLPPGRRGPGAGGDRDAPTRGDTRGAQRCGRYPDFEVHSPMTQPPSSKPPSAPTTSQDAQKEALRKSIGAAARESRRQMGLTQEDVADRLGVATEVYGRLE